MNGKQHQSNTTQMGKIEISTLEKVKERSTWFAQKRRGKKEAVSDMIDLDKWLEAKEKVSKREKEKKSVKGREERRKAEGGIGIKQEDERVEGDIIC